MSGQDQDRADRLAFAIDQLLAGQSVGSADPLLEIAAQLVSAPLGPSASAVARFEQQLDGWFKPSPRPPLRRLPLPVIVIGALAILIGVLLIVRLPQFSPAATATATQTASATLTPSLTATSSPTVSITATSAATPTSTSSVTAAPTSTIPTATAVFVVTPTLTMTLMPPTFARVVINGAIERIQGAVISVFGQAILIEGGASGLCVGDLVRVEVSVVADGTFQATRSAVTVESSACQSPPVRPPTSDAPGKNSGGGGGDDDDHHHRDD